MSFRGTFGRSSDFPVGKAYVSPDPRDPNPKFKPGDIISVSNVQMIIPHVGTLVDLNIDGMDYVGRVIGVNETTQVKIVSKDVKE